MATLIADTVLPDDIVAKPLTLSHTVFRFTFPYGGVRTTSAIALDTSTQSVENQALQIFSHVTSHLSKAHILNLLRDTPSQWKEKTRCAVDSTVHPFVLSPELYSLMSPFLKYTATQETVNFNSLKRLLKGLPTSSPTALVKDLHFEVLQDPSPSSSPVIENPRSPTPPGGDGEPTMHIATTGKAWIPPTMEFTRIMSGYNTASKQILSKQKVESVAAIDCGRSSVITTQHETLLHRLHGLQVSSQDKSMDWMTYRENLESILETNSSGSLNKEFEVVYPRIYSGVNIDLTAEEDPHAHLHSHLHTLHVIPVLRGLMSTGTGVSAASSKSIPHVTTVTRHEHLPSMSSVDADKESVESFSTLRGLIELFRHSEDLDAATLIGVVPPIYAINAEQYLREISQFERSSFKLPLTSVVDVESESPGSIKPGTVLRLLKDITFEICAVLKEETASKTLKTVRKKAKLIYHHPDQARFEDLFKIFKGINDSYSSDLDAYVRVMRELCRAVFVKDYMASIKFLVLKLAPSVGATTPRVTEHISATQCSHCRQFLKLLCFQFETGQYLCVQCYLSGSFSHSKLTSVLPIRTAYGEHTLSRASQRETESVPGKTENPTPTTTTTEPVSQMVGRHFLDWQDFFQACAEADTESLKITLAGLTCLRHSQLISELSAITLKGLEKVSLKVDGSDPTYDVELTSLIHVFSKELCYLLKDSKGDWSTGSQEFMSSLKDARQIAKVIYFYVEKQTLGDLMKLLAILSAAFLDPSHQNLPWVKSFLWRLISTSLEKPAHCAALQAFMRKIKSEAGPLPETTQRESASVMVSTTCSSCKTSFNKVAISISDGTVMCFACWWVSDVQGGAPLLLTAPDKSKVLPSIATSHLLAHQQNMLENVIGTRKAVLPDDRHAVMSTSVHEYSRVHKAPRDSTAILKESLIRGGTGHRLEEFTTIHELANKRHVTQAWSKANEVERSQVSKPAALPEKARESGSQMDAQEEPSSFVIQENQPELLSPTGAPDLEQSVETETLGSASPKQVFARPSSLTGTCTLVASSGVAARSPSQDWPVMRESSEQDDSMSSGPDEYVRHKFSKGTKIPEHAEHSHSWVQEDQGSMAAREYTSVSSNLRSQTQICEDLQQGRTADVASFSGGITKTDLSAENDIRREKAVESDAEERDQKCTSVVEEVITLSASSSQNNLSPPQLTRETEIEEDCSQVSDDIEDIPRAKNEEKSESESTDHSDIQLSGSLDGGDEQAHQKKLLQEEASEGQEEEDQGQSEEESELCSGRESSRDEPSPKLPKMTHDSETTSMTDDSGPTDRATTTNHTGLAPRGQLVSFKMVDSFTLESDHSVHSIDGLHMLSGNTGSVPLEISQELESGSNTSLSSRGPSPPSSVATGSPDRPLFQAQSLAAFRSESNTAESLLMNSDLLPADTGNSDTPLYHSGELDRHISLTASEVDVFKSVRKFDRNDSRHSSLLPSVNEGRHHDTTRRLDPATQRQSPRQPKRWPTATANAYKGYNSSSSRQEPQFSQRQSSKQEFSSSGMNNTSPRFAQPLRRQASPQDRREQGISRTIRSRNSSTQRPMPASSKPKDVAGIADRLMMGEPTRPSRRGGRVERWK